MTTSGMTAPSNVINDKGFRDRLFRAWYLFQAREGGERSQEWLAEAVSQQLGLEDTMHQSTISKWLNGAVPALGTIVALARVLGVDPGWLAFGSATNATPPSDPMKDGMRSILQPED